MKEKAVLDGLLDKNIAIVVAIHSGHLGSSSF